jgi:hypothetical protein
MPWYRDPDDAAKQVIQLSWPSTKPSGATHHDLKG